MELADILRKRGGRVTVARELVWDVLNEHGDHLTAQQISDRAVERGGDVNMSSVYRALELFTELDLVRESQTDADGSSTWEVRHPDDHIHLVCESCGTVLHHDTALVDRLRAELGGTFTVSTIDIRVTGTCPDC